MYFGFSSCFRIRSQFAEEEKITEKRGVKDILPICNDKASFPQTGVEEPLGTGSTEDILEPANPICNEKIEKKRESFSTLTAWRILAGDIISRGGTAAADEETESAPGAPLEDVSTLTPPMSPSSSSSSDGWNTGKVEDHYEPLDELGRGAFGRVVRARRKKDGAPACVKIITLLGSLGQKEREMVRNRISHQCLSLILLPTVS